MRSARAISLAPAVALLALAQAPAQEPWEAAAGGKQAFEVASVKRGNPGQLRVPNFPLSADDSYSRTAGHFSGSMLLATYIQFAYKIQPTREQTETMLAKLPAWVSADYIDIEARAEGNPTKDQMRLMMRSLLADRFKLAAHFETHQGKLFAMTLVKPGRMGPQLKQHDPAFVCDDAAPGRQTPPAKGAAFATPVCGAFMMRIEPNGMMRLSSNNISLDQLANSLSLAGGLDRPVFDRTGINGRFDFVLEFAAPPPVRLNENGNQPDTAGPAFPQALREQLGVKLESTEGPIRTLAIDHIETPTEN